MRPLGALVLMLVIACGRVNFDPLGDGGGGGGTGDGPTGDVRGGGMACPLTGTPACPESTLSLSMSGTNTSSGPTADHGNGLAGSCGGSGAEEQTVRFLVMSTATFTFTTRGSTYDTVLYLKDSCAGTELACNDDVAADGHSAITIALTQGQSVVAVIDGANGTCGNYSLTAGTSVTP